jgi:hypothetical protein
MGQLPQFVPESTVADRRRSDRQCAIRRTIEAFHCAPAAPCRRGPANRTARLRSPVGRAAWSVNQKLTAGASGPQPRGTECSLQFRKRVRSVGSQEGSHRGVAGQFRKAGQIEFMNHCQLPDCLHRDIRAHPDQIDPLRARTSSTSTSRKRTPSGGRLRKGTATPSSECSADKRPDRTAIRKRETGVGAPCTNHQVEFIYRLS